MRRVALLLLCAAPSSAQIFRAQPAPAFVPAYLGSVSLSLQNDSFYASRLLSAFSAELGRVTAAPTPRAATEGLKARIGGPANLSLPKVAAGLGAAALPAEQAAAVLAANALARPDQFQQVVDGLEGLKPGLGTRVTEALREAPAAGGSYAVLGRLRELGRTVVAASGDGTYDATGALRRFFDGR